MMLKTEMENAKQEYLNLKTRYNELFGKIKEEVTERFPSFTNEDVFRRAFCLVNNTYQRYSSALWGSGFIIEKALEVINESKLKIRNVVVFYLTEGNLHNRFI